MKRAKKMRLTSQIWVSAFLRAETVAGAYAAILRKGAAGAGAIFVVHNRLDSTYTVYSPAPQTVFEAGETTERRFEKVADAVGEGLDLSVQRAQDRDERQGGRGVALGVGAGGSPIDVSRGRVACHRGLGGHRSSGRRTRFCRRRPPYRNIRCRSIRCRGNSLTRFHAGNQKRDRSSARNRHLDDRLDFRST